MKALFSKFTPVFLAGIFVCIAPPAFSDVSQRSRSGLFPDEIISADELKKDLDGRENFILFDARDKKSFDSDHIPGAVLPRSEDYYQQEELFKNGVVPQAPDANKTLETAMQKYPHDTPIVVYCNTDCHASAALALRLKELGFSRVKSMEEGLQAWEKKGYPVARSGE